MLARRPIAVAAAAVLLTLVMVASAAASAVPTTAHAAPSAGTTAPLTGAPADIATGARIQAEIHADHEPLSTVFPPTFDPDVTVQNHLVTPDYPYAPDPNGIGDLGTVGVHGATVGTVSYTSSVRATVTVNGLNSTYVQGFGPDSVSIQLNTVLTGVDLFNSSVYQFWIQNVPCYVESTHQLYFVDNIWNFSSPAYEFTPNSMWSYDGIQIPPIYYFANGPRFTTDYPFTVTVYNNASVVNDRPTVYENYTVTLSNGVTKSGSYDRVEFNSTGNARPTHPAPAPSFQIDGKAVGANGFLPNDAEIELGGSDDGDTTNINAVNATMTLATLPNGTSHFVSVPAAYDHAFDTGETGSGIVETATGAPNYVAQLSAGPSIARPLWGLPGSVPGQMTVQFHVQPANAFVFGSTGTTFNASAAGWAPLLENGYGSYTLPPGPYSFEVLFANHDTKVVHVSSSGTLWVTLKANPNIGIDTPLYAWGNAQLANISSGGLGTQSSPYTTIQNASSTLNPLFGELNDFFFPVFAGIQIVHTSDFVTIANAPSLLVPYSLTWTAGLVGPDGLPNDNHLQMVFWHASHVSLVDDGAITGWFSSYDVGTLLSNVLFWNSSDDLLAGNDFFVQSVGLLIYGGSGDVLFGNTFTTAPTPCPEPYNVLNGLGNQTALMLAASGDLVYNNAFETPVSAVTPTQNPLTFVGSNFTDTWNITPAPASHTMVKNGFTLTGSVIGGNVEGGNYWSAYGTPADPWGVLPFNAGGGINNAGDDAPLVIAPLHQVTFTETGLPAGTLWTVTLNGTVFSSTTSTITFWDPAGAYGWSATSLAGFTAHPAKGAVLVGDGHAFVKVRWT
jgi:thermopsin